MIHQGDALTILRTLPDESVQMCCTSPPYWGLRDYGVAGQLGLERTPAEYVAGMVAVFDEVRRVLKPDGVMFLNLGDSYHARRAGAYGSDGKVAPGSEDRGSSSQSRRDGRTESGQSHSLGMPCPVHGPASESSEKTLAHRADQSDHPPIADSCLEQSRISSSTLGQKQTRGPSSSQPHALPNRSTPPVFGRQLPGESPRSDSSSACLDAGLSRNDGDVQSVHTKACICDILTRLEPSDRDRLGTAFSEMARPNFTLKPKDLIGIPWRVAFALQEAGWYLRCDVIWSKPNPMPESVTDRPTKAHEYIFLLSKSERYFYNADAIKEPASQVSIDRLDRARFEGWAPPGSTPHRGSMGARPAKADKQRGHSRRHAGFNDRWDAMELAEQTGVMRNKRSVWNIATRPFSEAHFATFPEEIPTVCILAGSRPGDVVLDPFNGAGTVGVVCAKTGRKYIGVELNPAYVEMANRRIGNVAPLFNQPE